MDADATGRAVLRRGSVDARLLGLRVGIPTGAWMLVPCECCVLLRDLCRADHSFRGVLPNVVRERDREASVMALDH